MKIDRVLSRSLLLTALIGAPGSAALAQEHGHGQHTAPTHPDAEAVAAVIEAYHDALASGDGEAALALLAEDAVILESGGLETKAQYTDHHLPGDMAFAQAVPRTRSEIHVTGHGDVAWAWSTSETRGTYRDREIDSVGAELMVLVKGDQGWRLRGLKKPSS